jgi:hypothetical protein
MTDQPNADMIGPRALRILAFLVAGAGTLFWLYTFYGIAQVPQGDGTGFQWVAIMPIGFFYFGLCFPALVLAWKGRSLRLAVGLGCAGLVALLVLWGQLLTELYP